VVAGLNFIVKESTGKDIEELTVKKDE